MTWNFDYTIPSFIVLSFFLIYYFIKPNILVHSNKYFLALILLEMIGFISDIVSSYSDGHSQLFYRSFLVFLDGFYFTLFIIRHCIISLFFAALLKIDVKKDIPSLITLAISFIILVLILINPFTELLYKVTPEGKYLRTDKYIFIYIASFTTLLLDLYYIIKNINQFEKTELLSSFFSIFALLLGSTLKILFPKYLIIDMFFLFVIVALFLAFENPEIYLEKKTSLYNQKAFKDVINEYFFLKKKVALISFYIKNYPEKREIYGSQQTDMALKEIGKYFKSTFKNKKLFYLRNGRFTIVDNNTKDFPYLRAKVIERFKQPWDIELAKIHLSIAIIDMGTEIKINRVEDIYSCFRIAFEEIKNIPDNHLTIDKKTFQEINHNTMVQKALNKALLDDELKLYLQPIIDSETRKIIAAEALVRIEDEKLGLIPPVEFITMAEKNGSIEQLGDQILNKVCKFIKTTGINKQGIEWINVNLSPIQCQNTNLPEKIDEITNVYTIPHENIHLEITEDSMIDTQILQKQMNLLITNGYNFSLDDFGTGFSNITRLKKFPFDNIKIDMTIVRDHFQSPDLILPSIVQALTDRGLSVTAEGVETKEMADGLQKMGCKYLQGYYFSKPIPCNEFEKLVKANS